MTPDRSIRPRRWAARALAVGIIAVSGTGVALIASQPAPPAAAGAIHAKPGRVDIGFCQDMIVHHYQAVVMAREVLNNADPEVRAIANGILTNQLTEIGWMQGALALWGAPAAARQPMSWMSTGPNMPGMGPSSDGSMPGLASQAELNRLGHLRGRALDVLFLQLMIRHHEGGIEMARYAAGHTRLLAVRALAIRMDFDESQEITTMVALLRTDHAKTLPYPNEEP